MNSHDLNTKLVHYSDPYCMYNMNSAQGRTVLKIHPGQIVFFQIFTYPLPGPEEGKMSEQVNPNFEPISQPCDPLNVVPGAAAPFSVDYDPAIFFTASMGRILYNSGRCKSYRILQNSTTANLISDFRKNLVG